ncbi:MAG: FxSxx-COOH system tetratricopeptide repeat protein [Streptosporangiaceae bacterium]
MDWPVYSGHPVAPADAQQSRPETGAGLDLIGLGGAADDAAGRVTILVGPDGYGKSCLASAALASLPRSGPPDLRGWVDATSRATIVAGYAQAAADIGLIDPGVAEDLAAARFADWLARTDRSWLLVLDDLAEPGELGDLLPAAGRGELVVTCRPEADLAVLAGRAPRMCRIGELSPREALTYLTSRLYDDMDQRIQAVDLAADLGYMPLALSLAAATMAGTALSCREYRLRFAGRWQELAGRSLGDQLSPADVAWSLAMDRADLRPPAGLARALLAILALLAPAEVPGRLLTSTALLRYLASRGVSGAPEEKLIWAVLANLAQTGLVTVGWSRSGRGVLIHSVIAATTLRLTPATVLDDASTAAADGMAEVWPRDRAEPDLARMLRECARRLAAAAGGALWQPRPHPVLLLAGADYDDGSPALAPGYWQSLLARSAQTLGPEHPQTLALRDRLAAACERSGRLDDAIALTLISLAEREQIQGASHPDVAAARLRLAGQYRTAGRYPDAIAEFGRVLADREWALGADHPDALAARGDLAGAYQLAGQVDQAILLYQRNLAYWAQAGGADHPGALADSASVGLAYQSAGRYDEAIATFRRVRAATEQALGRAHPDTLTAIARLAYAYREAGRLKDAIPLYRQTLAGRESVLGGDHPDTLTALANLASCCHAAHRIKDAVGLYERLVAARERIQGADHPDTLIARGNLASGYHSAGRLADALPLYERTVRDFERVRGPDHPDTLTSRCNLANAYYLARRQSAAIAEFERTLADCDRVLGAGHPLTVAIRDNLAAITK